MGIYLWSLTAQNVKNLNKHTVLDLIRFTPGGISRAELAHQLSLSRAAVTSIVNDLLSTQTIHEVESRATSSGRPPIILEINPGRGFVAGVDMGASHITIIIADFAAKVVNEIETPFDISRGPEACLLQAHNLLQDLLEKSGISLKDILAVGIGVPGPISSSEGMVVAPPIMPGWDLYPIRDDLSKRWRCEISLNNDAELGALGEWAYGAGRGERNLAYIKVGTGIGAGLLLDGRIYQGATGAAGEIGHITIEDNGPECNCGNRGCLEALAGGRAIALQAQTAVRKGKRTILSDIKPVEAITARDIAYAARRGDLISQQIFSQAGNYLGIAIAGMVNLFNPDMIVVGGGVSQIGDLILQPVREIVQKRSLRAAGQTARITTATLRRRSSGIGAVVQALSIALHETADRKEVRSD